MTKKESAMESMGEEVSFEDMDSGLESFTRTLTTIPIIQLAQSMTPAVQEQSDPALIAGVFMNNDTKAFMGKTLKIHVLRCWKSRVKFPPRDTGSTTAECSCPLDGVGAEGTEFGKCSRCEWANFDLPEHCQTQFNMVVTLGDNPDDQYRVILARTSLKYGRKFEKAISALTNKEKLPMFMYEVELKADKVKGKYTYFTYDFEITGKKLPEDKIRAFKDACLDVQRLRKEALDRHQEYLAQKKASGEGTTSHFDTMADNVEQPDIPMVDDGDDSNVPF